MPLLGFGIWKLSCEECTEAVYNIKMGDRHIDAHTYTNSLEAGIGVRNADFYQNGQA